MTRTPDDLRHGLRGIAADAPPFDAPSALRRLTEASTASGPHARRPDIDPLRPGVVVTSDEETGLGDRGEPSPSTTSEAEVEVESRDGVLHPADLYPSPRLPRRGRRPGPWLIGAAAAASLVAVVLPGALHGGAESGHDAVVASSPAVTESAEPRQALLGEEGRSAAGRGAGAPETEGRTYLVPPDAPAEPQGVPAVPRPPDVRLAGRLVDVGQGCVALKRPDGFLVPIIWPEGTRPMPTIEGLAVVAPDGRALGATESGQVSMVLDGRFVPTPPSLCSGRLSTRSFQVRAMSDERPRSGSPYR